MENEMTVENHPHYSIVLRADKKALVFNWKQVVELSLQDFRKGVAEFAGQCKTHKPSAAVIDARQLDPNGVAVGWVSGRKKSPDEEEYGLWWARDIVPIYHDAGISSLAIATGDPNAPGEAKQVPPGVNFKMGYFTDLESALRWKVV